MVKFGSIFSLNRLFIRTHWSKTLLQLLIQLFRNYYLNPSIIDMLCERIASFFGIIYFLLVFGSILRYLSLKERYEAKTNIKTNAHAT